MNINAIDISLLAEHVRKTAEAEPQTVSDCQYFNFGTGAAQCVVGQAMALQGFTLADVGEDSNIASISVVLDERFDEHRETITWLNTVQSWQDSGYCWSDAVAEADKYA